MARIFLIHGGTTRVPRVAFRILRNGLKYRRVSDNAGFVSSHSSRRGEATHALPVFQCRPWRFKSPRSPSSPLPSWLASAIYTIMNLRETAGSIARQLKKEIGAEQVWLFGSQARGDSGVDSDIDILAVVPDSPVSRYRRAVTARKELSRFNVPMDVIVLTRDEWNKEIKAPSSLASAVAREGIPL